MRNKLLTAFLLGMIFFLLLGYTNNWVESTPTDATVANQIDDFNRKVRVDVAERLETYIAGFNSSDSNAGFYNVLFIENAAALSTPAANKGLLYGLLVNSKCELAYTDEDGDEVQLTTGGDIGGVHVSLLAGKDLLGSSTSDITINTNKFTVAGATGNTVIAGTLDVGGSTAIDSALDEDDMVSDSATGLSTQQSIKKYVDDRAGIYARLYKSSADQSVSSADPTLVVLDGESFDSGTIAGSNKITPGVIGYYQVNACISASGIAIDKSLSCLIYKNGGLSSRITIRIALAAVTSSINFTDLIYLDADDYVELYVQSDDTSYTVEKATTETFLSLCASGK